MPTPALLSTLASLTPEQSACVQAIVHPPEGVQAVRILAAAGSGKTRVVACAVASLAEQPGGLTIATTFTRKGREEMARRVTELAPATSRVRVATLNSLAMTYATGNGGALALKLPEVFGHAFMPGYQLDMGGRNLPLKGSTLVERIAGRRLLKRGSKTELVEIPGLEGTGFYGLSVSGNPKDPDPDFREAITAESPKSYGRWLSLFRQRGWVGGEPEADPYIRALEGDMDAIEALRAMEPDPLTVAWRDQCLAAAGRFPYFGKFWFMWLQAKQKLRAWDFIDTLYAYWRFGTDGAARVIVDEAQDSSWLQMQIELRLARMGGGVVVLVGDVRQSIFGFQGAMPSFMANLPLVIPTHTAEITTNFRSWRQIVGLGNAVSAGQEWAVGSPSVPARRVAGSLEPGRVELVSGGGPYGTVDLLVQRIAADIAEHKDPGRHAVLCRVHSHADLFEMAMLRAGIPIVRLGEKRTFFESMPAKKIVSYLWLAANPTGAFAAGIKATAVKNDPGLLARIANGEAHHLRYIGTEAFLELGARAVAAGQTEILSGLRWMRDNTENGSLRQGLSKYITDVEKVQAQPWPKVLDTIERLLVPPPADNDDATDDEEDDTEDPYAQMRAAIATIRAIAEGRDLRALGQFIQQVKTAASTVVRFSAGPEDAAFANEYDNVKKACVTLSTIHTSKGLEWPHVTVLVQTGLFPLSKGDPDEEKRLFYVAATRAENHLTVGTVTLTGDDDEARPLGSNEYADITANYLERDASDALLSARGVQMGWRTESTQVQLAARVLTWSHPTEAKQLRCDLETLSLDQIVDGRPERLYTPDPTTSWDERTAVVLKYLEDALGVTPPVEAAVEVSPVEVEPLEALAATRRHTFHGWLDDHDLGDAHEVADRIIDYAIPLLTQAEVSARLGWSTVGDLERVVQAVCPMPLTSTTPVVAKHAGGVTTIWRGASGVLFAGAVPVDLGHPRTRWGSTTMARAEVEWISGGRETLPVDADVFAADDPRLPGLRLGALRYAPDAATPVTAVAVLVDRWRVEEHPKGSGAYRIMEGDTLLGVHPRSAVLVAEAYQRAAQPPIVDVPDAHGTYRVGAVLREQEVQVDIVATSAVEAIARLVARDVEPRWAALVARAGGIASDPVAHWHYTDPSGNRYACAFEPIAEAPQEAPVSVGPAPAPVARTVGSVALPHSCYLVADFTGETPTTVRVERGPRRLRDGTIVMQVNENEREVFRVDITPGAPQGILSPLYRHTPPRIASLERLEELGQQFYAKLRTSVQNAQRGDALEAWLTAHPQTLTETRLARQLWALFPAGGFTLEASAIRSADALLPTHNAGPTLATWVDNGLLSVVGGTGIYRWEIGPHVEETPEAASATPGAAGSGVGGPPGGTPGGGNPGTAPGPAGAPRRRRRG